MGVPGPHFLTTFFDIKNDLFELLKKVSAEGGPKKRFYITLLIISGQKFLKFALRKFSGY
jgi:hypothetical protein